jgi:hypothetical protein
MSRQQNPRQSHNIKIADKSFENVVNLKMFGTMVTNSYYNDQ